jgi:predicted metal-dependent phosphoesterase TrpH
MRIDLHCHTEASWDCITPLSKVLPRCQARGVAVQAITDHNEIWAAQELKSMAAALLAEGKAAPTIIVGEEISTREGEIIGLFLEERIPRDLSAEETVSRIKAQGGLVLVPHGFDPVNFKRLRPVTLARLASTVDIIEVFNARISKPRWNKAAAAWADERQVLKSSGSDAHTLADIGSAWVETAERPIYSPEDLRLALETGTPEGIWTHPLRALGYKIADWVYQTVRR